MAKYLTDRQDRKLEEMARKLDGLSGRNNRLPSPSSQITGTDFGSVIVPRETIPAATRNVQAGSDDFTPGVGTAYLFKRATGGEIEPRLDRDGAVIFRTVYNLSTQAYAPNNAAPTTDYIGPNTSVLFAMMDRSGKLFIPPDEEDDGTAQIAKNGGSPIAAFSGSTPGSGTVDIWTFTNGTIADSLENVTAYNFYDYPVPANELIIIRKDETSGRWLVDMDGQHTIEDDQGSPGTETLFPYETLKIATTNPSGNVTVTKTSTTVTASIDLNSSNDGLPPGAFVPSYLEPILDTGKYYMDRDGAADTNWALADGVSNVTPGSGIVFWDRASSGDTFFVRAHTVLEDTDDTAFGRTVAATPDDDEVTIAVAVDTHVDHVHSFDIDVCHDDVLPSETHFDFSTADTKFTSIQKKATSTIGDPLDLEHTVILTLTNDQGADDDKIEMTPPNKHLHWFERVA